jgi:hypothetical protein
MRVGCAAECKGAGGLAGWCCSRLPVSAEIVLTPKYQMCCSAGVLTILFILGAVLCAAWASKTRAAAAPSCLLAVWFC